MKTSLQPKRLIRLFLAIILIATTAHPSNGQMRQIYLDNTQEDNQINKISFYSSSSGFVAFTYWLGYTNDSGRTFTKKYVTLNNVNYSGYSINLTFGFGIKGIKAFDQNNIIVWGDYGLVPAILSSKDGGNTFKVVYSHQFASIPSGGVTDLVFPQNDNVGYAADVDQIIKTTDKGMTWSAIVTSANSAFDHLSAIDNNTVFAISNSNTDDIFSSNGLPFSNNKILKIINGGSSWQTLSLPPGSLQNAFFLTAAKGWVNMDHNFFYTSNGGTAWSQKNSTTANPFYGGIFQFINDSTGFAVSGFDVLKTYDSGKAWEPLPRDNNYSYLGYGNNDLQVLNANQLWVGGGHGFLELSTDGGGIPLPKAYFTIDTTGLVTTGIVKLVNYSKAGYTYQWFLNDVLLSTQYNASYVHDMSSTTDVIKLIVSDGVRSDTTVLVQYFYQTVSINSFDPGFGTEGTYVIINGSGFDNATAVSFGGVPSPIWNILSDKQIAAYVGQGASGNVLVSTPGGSAVLSGFTYEPLLTSNLPVKLSDSILCKSEQVLVTISNTQANVRYELLDSLGNTFGYVNSRGGTASFLTSSISVTGHYTIRASSIDVPTEVPKTFTNQIFIRVEHTRSSFAANRVNVGIGETFSYVSHSPEAQTYKWTFNGDASIISSTLSTVSNISYASPGLKTLTLVSTSLNGCSDTLTSDAITVYKKPPTDETCYAQNIDDSDFSYLPASAPSSNKVLGTSDNGYIISGVGNQPILKSRYGVSKHLSDNSTAYAIKYTSAGVVSWYLSIPGGGEIYAVDKDDKGNIYVLGLCNVLHYLKLPNGDSLRISAMPSDTISYEVKTNGFILKLDSAGNYIWHAVLNDDTPLSSGYTILGGAPFAIQIKGDEMIIGGGFLSRLSYYKDGIEQALVSLPLTTDGRDRQDQFILKLKTDGTLLWNMYFKNDAVNNRFNISGLGIDNADQVYVSGYYERQIIVHDAGDVTSFTLTGETGSSRAYVFKFDANGHYIWKTIFKSANPYGSAQINDIVTDGNGTSYLTGSGTGKLQIINANSSTDSTLIGNYFVMKFDSSGLYKWSAGSISDDYTVDEGISIFLKDGHLHSLGRFSGYRDLDTATYIITSTDETAISRLMDRDVFFLADYDTSGILKKFVESGHNPGQPYIELLHPNNLVVDNNENYIVSGITESYGFDTISIFNNTIVADGYDAFFCKLNAGYCYAALTPSADAGKGATRCAGDTVRIGSPGQLGNYYCWTSKPEGFSSVSPNPVVVVPEQTTKYYLSVTNSSGLIAKDSVQVTIGASAFANAGMDDSICKGSSITLGTTAVSGNTYQWTSYPKGFTSSVANPTIAPDSTAQYFLSVHNSTLCSGKDTVVIMVNKVQVPGVSISASDTDICVGASVRFSAASVNGGFPPYYQWTQNGANVSSDSASFTTSALQNGDIINLILKSNAVCATPATVSSNSIAISVNSVTPSVRISGIDVVQKDSITNISASVINEGNSPVYQWQDSTTNHSWQAVLYATGSVITYMPRATGDKIRCVLTSNASCTTIPIVTSDALYFTVNVPDTPVETSVGKITLYPNPVHSVLTIDSLNLTDGWQTLQIANMNGLQNIIAQNITGLHKVFINVAKLQSGMYVAILRRQNGNAVYLRFIKL